MIHIIKSEMFLRQGYYFVTSLSSNTSCHLWLVSQSESYLKWNKRQKSMILKFAHLEIWAFPLILILLPYAISAEFSILIWVASYKTIYILDFMWSLNSTDPGSLSKNGKMYSVWLEIVSIPVTGHLVSSSPQLSSPATAPRLSVSVGIWKQQHGSAPETFSFSHQGLRWQLFFADHLYLVFVG